MPVADPLATVVNCQVLAELAVPVPVPAPVAVNTIPTWLSGAPTNVKSVVPNDAMT